MRLFRVALCIILVMMLIACSNDKENSKSMNAKKSDDEVEVTLPAILFQNQDFDTLTEKAKSKGVNEVVKNEDGSLTYKMTKSVYNELFNEIETTITKMVDEGKKKLQSVKDITHNKTLSEFTFVVDRKSYENSMDGLVIYTLGVVALNYQIFKEKDSSDDKVSISLKDEKTGDVFSVFEFPDVLEGFYQEKNKK